MYTYNKYVHIRFRPNFLLKTLLKFQKYRISLPIKLPSTGAEELK